MVSPASLGSLDSQIGSIAAADTGLRAVAESLPADAVSTAVAGSPEADAVPTAVPESPAASRGTRNIERTDLRGRGVTMCRSCAAGPPSGQDRPGQFSRY